MSSYEILATCYDRLTEDVAYEQWANYVHGLLSPLSGDIVLDLACGTGSLTYALADLGWEMIGVDLSEDMLAQAMEKNYEYSGKKPMFLCQSMEKLDLYGTIDACVCCLDSINYVTEPEILEQAFQRVFLFLAPEGKFLFDIKSPYAFAEQDGQFSLDEAEDFYCVWRTESSEKEDIFHHTIDLFLRQGELWHREEEIHYQRVYSVDTLVAMLERCGFVKIQTFGFLSQEAPREAEERIFIMAEKLSEK